MENYNPTRTKKIHDGVRVTLIDHKNPDHDAEVAKAKGVVVNDDYEDPDQPGSHYTLILCVRKTWEEVVELFEHHNKKHGVTSQFSDDDRLHAVVVFKQSNFNQEYTEESRSYKVASDNKAFLPDMCGSSIFGECLDGSELLRLENYIGRWEIEECYMA